MKDSIINLIDQLIQDYHLDRQAIEATAIAFHGTSFDKMPLAQLKLFYCFLQKHVQEMDRSEG